MEEKKTMKQRIDETKTNAKAKWYSVCDWASRNKEALIVILPVAISGSIELIKIVSRKSSQKEDRRLKENFIYDRSSGHYYETRRQPKNSEWIEIDRRHNTLHQPLGEVLRDMRLLK